MRIYLSRTNIYRRLLSAVSRHLAPLLQPPRSSRPGAFGPRPRPRGSAVGRGRAGQDTAGLSLPALGTARKVAKLVFPIRGQKCNSKDGAERGGGAPRPGRGRLPAPLRALPHRAVPHRIPPHFTAPRHTALDRSTPRRPGKSGHCGKPCVIYRLGSVLMLSRFFFFFKK